MIIKNKSELEKMDSKIIIYEKTKYCKMLIDFFENCIRDINFYKENLAVTQAEEIGKPIMTCYNEIERCKTQLKEAILYITKMNRPFFIQESDFSGICNSNFSPIGTVLAITAFSSPYSSFIHKVIPSIITQNKLIFKPSPRTFKCSDLFFEIINDNYSKIMKNDIICLNFENDMLDYILPNISFNYIMFTGTSFVAKSIKNKFLNIPGTYETGSNALAYVEENYNDLDKLSSNLINNAFEQSGMRCIGLKNLFINKKIATPLIASLVKNANKIICGDPLNCKTVVGPIYDIKQREILDKTLVKLTNNGYKVLCGGKFVGNMLKPTMLLDNDATVASTDEMFGPILCIHVVHSYKDIPNEYYKRSSINTSIYTASDEIVNAFVSYCDSLNVCVNYGPALRLDTRPFGGKNDENEGIECLQSIIPKLVEKKYVIKNIT